MVHETGSDPLELSKQERALVEFELMPRFGQYPTLDEGIRIRRWATGDRKGQPKIPIHMQSMMDRGIMRIRDEADPYRVQAAFTEVGIEALRRTARSNRRFLAGERFGPLRAELGLDP